MNFAIEDLANFDVSVYKYEQCLIEMYVHDDIYLNEENGTYIIAICKHTQTFRQWILLL